MLSDFVVAPTSNYVRTNIKEENDTFRRQVSAKMAAKRLVPLLIMFLAEEPHVRTDAFSLASSSHNNIRIAFQNQKEACDTIAAPRNGIANRGAWRRRLPIHSNAGSSVPSSRGDGEGFISKSRNFASKNFFLLGMFSAVGLARAFPAMGKNGGVMRPELFIGEFGVTLIFLLSGISLELKELTKAASDYKLNASIQMVTFAAWPFLVGLPLKLFFTKLAPGIIPVGLSDGLLILTCLPTTVNMCILLTQSGGGNSASAICNAVISNLLGIFLTPLLLLKFFGTHIQLPFLDMVIKLCNKVLLPVAIGQALRTTKAKYVYEKRSKLWKRIQEVILLGIVWNAFCNTFSSGLGLGLKHALVLLALLPAVHLASLGVLFKGFSHPAWKLSRPDVVSAMFCASQKTLAFGLPLVNTVFEGNPNLALYCAPIMFIHPLQLILGSILLPWISKYVEGVEE